jgi:hypothetical protein
MLLFVRFLLDYHYTLNFDIIFPDRATYDLVRDSGVLSRASVCRIFGIDTAQITDHVEFDPALAIKFTIYRRMPSGSPGDADIFGSQPEYRDAVGRSDEIRRCELPPKSTAIQIFLLKQTFRIAMPVAVPVTNP